MFALAQMYSLGTIVLSKRTLLFIQMYLYIVMFQLVKIVLFTQIQFWAQMVLDSQNLMVNM